MPLVLGTKQIQDTPIEKPLEVGLNDPSYKAAVVSSREDSYMSLITHVAGASWSVIWYSQQLGSDDELTSFQLDKDPVYQQYIKISNLELKVSDGLQQTQNTETNEFEVTGSATLYPGVIPNIGDVFVADVGDGRNALFSVIETERLSILKETCYHVNYILLFYVDSEIEANLASKTVKVTHFIKKLLSHGEDPIIVDEDYNRYLSLTEIKKTLLTTFFHKFFNRGISSFAIPNQDILTYDPFVVKHLLATLEQREHNTIRILKNYSVELPDANPAFTVWDMLLESDLSLLNILDTKVNIVPSKYFGIIPQFGSIYYTDVKNVMFPIRDGSVIIKNLDSSEVVKSLIEIPNDSYTTGLIKPVTIDDYYVFSSSFYEEDTANMSKLELLVYNALTKRIVDRAVVVELHKEINTWGELEQFYYIPILLTVIKMSLFMT